MKIILPMFYIVVVVSFLCTWKILKRLKRDSPAVFSAAGIREIDWWFSCLRGVFRLAFSGLANEIDWRSRSVLRIFSLCYVLLIVISVLLAFAPQALYPLGVRQ